MRSGSGDVRTAADAAPEAILSALRAKFPRAGVVLTLGASGSVAEIGGERVAVAAKRVKAVDTTAAGDTYIGYFLAARQRGLPLKTSMEKATEAAAICVTHAGAAPSIPRI